MLLPANIVSTLCTALGLTPSILKPIPVVGTLVNTVDGVLNATEGILGSLPLLGSILETEGNTQVPAPSPASSRLDTMDSLCGVDPYNPPEIMPHSFPPFDQAKANVLRYRQQQSVNLGSWFVHEQWMTPSVFTCAASPQLAEIDIASGWNSTANARAVLERHWDTFINQSDFDYLASIGINTVRLPIGYWSLGPPYCQGTPFESVADVYTNSWPRVLRAIRWAAQAGIGVLLDLHGAPGSQNGQPHSGISDGITNLFNNVTNMDKTTEVLSFLVQELAPVTNVVGIELLNEPENVPELSSFYTQLLTSLRKISPEASQLPLYIQDAFDLNRFSDFVSARTDFVVEDHHSYFVFTPADNAESASDHTEDIETSVATQLSDAKDDERGNIIVGEWSCALTPDSLANVSDPASIRQQFCEGQQQTYTNNTAGWSFWSYNKEDCDTDQDWCFKNAVGKTLPETFFPYGNDSAVSPTQFMSSAVVMSQVSAPSMYEVLERAGITTVSALTMPSDSAGQTISVSSSSAAMSTSPVARRKRDTAIDQHRFSTIHSRHAPVSVSPPLYERDSSTSSPPLNNTELAITKGYSDGFMTAMIFAQNGMSKLGFTGQYIADSISALGYVSTESGQEYYYSEWFRKGLADGEASVASIISTTS